jgi:hypothetical protein
MNQVVRTLLDWRVTDWRERRQYLAAFVYEPLIDALVFECARVTLVDLVTLGLEFDDLAVALDLLVSGECGFGWCRGFGAGRRYRLPLTPGDSFAKATALP